METTILQNGIPCFLILGLFFRKFGLNMFQFPNNLHKVLANQTHSYNLLDPLFSKTVKMKSNTTHFLHSAFSFKPLNPNSSDNAIDHRYAQMKFSHQFQIINGSFAIRELSKSCLPGTKVVWNTNMVYGRVALNLFDWTLSKILGEAQGMSLIEQNSWIY